MASKESQQYTMAVEPREPGEIQGSLADRIGPVGEFVQGNSSSRSRKRKRGDRDHEEDVVKEPLLTPWIASLGVTEYESKEQRLHDEIMAYVHYIQPTPQEVEVRKIVSARVEEVAVRRFRDARVHTYGSVTTNLSLPHGDVDLVIETRHVETLDEKKRTLFQLRDRLRNDGIATATQVNARARVPVLSFVSTPESGSINIDVTINGTDGVKAIDIIIDHLKRMPALRPLILVLKGLLLQHNFHSAASSGLSSYALTCMTISFIQLNPMNRPKDFFDDPVQTESLGHLFMDFLNYYGSEFPYATSYISVNTASIKSKESKGWDAINVPERLCIECLINPENDIGKPTGKIKAIRTLFQDSLSALQSATLETTQLNILGIILGVPQETIDYREHVRRIVDQGLVYQLRSGRSWSKRGSSHISAGGYPIHTAYSHYASQASKRPRYERD